MTLVPQLPAPGYDDFLRDLKDRIRTAQVKAELQQAEGPQEKGK